MLLGKLDDLIDAREVFCFNYLVPHAEAPLKCKYHVHEPQRRASVFIKKVSSVIQLSRFELKDCFHDFSYS